MCGELSTYLLAFCPVAVRKERVMIPCACGCGELIETPDSKGRPRKMKNGHQKGNLQYLIKDGSFWLGRKHRPESREKMSAAQDRGSMTYWATHKWMQRHAIRTGVCEICHQEKLTEWAQRNHKQMTRDRSNWLELCKSCHAHYDIRHNGKKQGRAARSASQ